MVGSPPDSQAAIASSVAIETPAGRLENASRRWRRSSARRSAAICLLTTRIVWWKWATEGAILAIAIGFAFEMPIVFVAESAARAAAGRARAAAIRAWAICVRFVSKRGTVASSATLLRDPDHIPHIPDADRHSSRHEVTTATWPLNLILRSGACSRHWHCALSGRGRPGPSAGRRRP